jgi:S1-C subfamily serine protease
MPGDVITAIDGKPTRDIAELVRVLGAMRVGDDVKVEYRRGRRAGAADVVLTPKR